MASSVVTVQDSNGVWWQLGVDVNGRTTWSQVAAPPVPSVVTPTTGTGRGMSRSEIIELADQYTEKKGLVFNRQLMLAHRIQRFCGENRFWWRKKTLSFTTVANAATYDLTDPTLTFSPAFSSASGVDVEEITEFARIDSPSSVNELDPIFDDLSAIEILEGTDVGKPIKYLMDPNSYQILRVAPIPDGAYKLRLMFWGMPNPSPDAADDSVPLVPAYLHYCLVDGLKMDIFEVLYGTQDEKYAAAKAVYDADVLRAEVKQSFDASRSVQLISRDLATRSTR